MVKFMVIRGKILLRWSVQSRVKVFYVGSTCSCGLGIDARSVSFQCAVIFDRCSKHSKQAGSCRQRQRLYFREVGSSDARRRQRNPRLQHRAKRPADQPMGQAQRTTSHGKYQML